MIISKRNKIKIKGKQFNISVLTYNNKRIRLRYENKNEGHDITIDVNDAFIDDGCVFLNPAIEHNGVLKELKKYRIIKEFVGVYNYNYIDLPVAKLNMGILRKFDLKGIEKHFDVIQRGIYE